MRFRKQDGILGYDLNILVPFTVSNVEIFGVGFTMINRDRCLIMGKFRLLKFHNFIFESHQRLCIKNVYLGFHTYIDSYEEEYIDLIMRYYTIIGCS